MKISLNWLRDFVELPRNINPQELAERLSLSVVEVEGWEREEDKFARMVVGKVVSIEKHPNADRLAVCKVDIGALRQAQGDKRRTVEIVCGGKNLREGMLVAVALPGAGVRWHGEGEPIALEETEIRGVKSCGMICAGGEIGLDDLQAQQEVVGDSPQILDISFTKTATGAPLATALKKDDVVFEISNVSLSNRPDLWGHIGIAREVAVMFGKKLKRNKIQGTRYNKFPNSKFQIPKSHLSVKVEDKKLCPRYMGVLAENVHIAKTPDWMAARLMAVGQRPLSPLVDISNYVMFETGQPVHIFDESKVKSQKSKVPEIVIRRARKGEVLKTLDDIERKLDSNMLVIANIEKPIAIAGVMGGENSGVSEDTHAIVIECATFEPVSIRQTSSKLGLKTDASQRFEKSLDPHLPPIAVARVWQLIQECADAGKIPVALSLADCFVGRAVPKAISLSLSILDHRVGMSVPRPRAKAFLAGLGFSVAGTSKTWRVTPPSWRATRDVSIPEDIIEEIARHLDYNTISDALPVFPITPPPVSRYHELERALKRFLTGAGFIEVEHKPFLNPQEWERYGLETGTHVEVVNPIDPTARYLRQSLIPGLLQDIRLNRSEAERLKFFEWGRVFHATAGEYAVKKKVKERLPRQPVMLSFVLCADEDEETMLRHAKGVARALLQAGGIEVRAEMYDAQEAGFKSGSLYALMAGNVQVGMGGVVSSLLKAALGVPAKQSVAMVSINIDALVGITPYVNAFSPLPAYPAVSRDLAIVIDEKVSYGEIEKAIRGRAGNLMESLTLFDVFRGKGIQAGMKSFAFHLVFRAQDRTLKSDEVEEIMQKVTDTLTQQFSAVVRK